MQDGGVAGGGPHLLQQLHELNSQGEVHSHSFSLHYLFYFSLFVFALFLLNSAEVRAGSNHGKDEARVELSAGSGARKVPQPQAEGRDQDDGDRQHRCEGKLDRFVLCFCIILTLSLSRCSVAPLPSSNTSSSWRA